MDEAEWLTYRADPLAMIRRQLEGVPAPASQRRLPMTRLLLGLLALCLSAGSAAGQEPIVELKVTPEKSAFKNSAWNKPIVVKSQDEAGKHFGKDALEEIARKVDFKKQIVLVFAWQGSGGDKLEYSILESFPEQIP